MLFLSFKHLFVEIGIDDDDDDGALWCTAHTALIALEQVHTLVTYPDVSTSPLKPCLPLLRLSKQLYEVALFDEQVLVVSLSSQFSV